MARSLPFRPTPQPGESPLSVIRRGALGNHHTSTLRFAYALNPALDHSPTGLASAARSVELQQNIFEPMGLLPDEIRQASYGRIGGARLDALVWNGLQVPIGDLQFRRSRICVACYTSDGYAHSVWDHVATLACPKHRVLLDDACPCCRAPWKPAGDPLACGCPPDQMAARQQPCTERVATTMQRIVVARDQEGLNTIGLLWRVLALWSKLGMPLDRPAVSGALAELSRGEWPYLPSWGDGVVLHPRVALAPLLAADDPASRAAAQTLLRKAMPPIHTSQLDVVRWSASAAQAVLGIGRVPFDKLVRARHVLPDSDGRFPTRTLNDLLQLADGTVDNARAMLPLTTLRGGLHRESLATLISRIKSGEITNHRCEATAGLSSLCCALATPADMEIPHEITIRTAADQLNSNIESVRAAVQLKLLPATKGSSSSAVQWTISVRALDAFKSEYVFASAVAKQYGAPVRTAASRLRSAGLAPVSGPGIDGGVGFLFRRADLERIDLAQAFAGPYRSPAGRKKGTPQRSSLTFLPQCGQEAAREVGISLRQLREVVRGGWISPHAIVSRRQVFDREEVLELRRRLDRDFVPLSDAAQQLGQTQSQFRTSWIATGILTAHRFADRRLVETAAFDRIKALWCDIGSASSIGAGLKRPRWLCPNLTQMGQLPEPTRMGNGVRHVRLYPRNAAPLQRYVVV